MAAGPTLTGTIIRKTKTDNIDWSSIMTLYAFDGTHNKNEQHSFREDKEGKDNSNVCNLLDFYRDHYGQELTFCRSGPGTRGWKISEWFGGLFGAGSKKRVKEGLKAAEENFRKGDTTIDVIGYSRGAAKALDFAHRVTLFEWSE